MSQSLPKQEKYVVNSTNYKNISLVSLYIKYVHHANKLPPKTQNLQKSYLELSRNKQWKLLLWKSSIYFLKVWRILSDWPNKSVMLTLLQCYVCVHRQCIDSHICININLFVHLHVCNVFMSLPIKFYS